jgi:hypothetical protein
MTIASPANAATTCGGTLTSPDGGSTILFADGGVGALEACSILVDVVAGTPGTHTVVTGDLTSEAGNSGSAGADLIVATDRPGFGKSFSPASVLFGERSTLTFFIDNSLNTASAAGLTFSDPMPFGMRIAEPAFASTDCAGGVLTAVPGESVVTYRPAFFGDASVAASSSCTVSVDVIGGSVGHLGNSTGELTSTTQFGGVFRSSGKANAVLSVGTDQLVLNKSFVDDPIAPGDTVTLEFVIRNLDRRSLATNIEFTDDLDAMLAGTVASNLPLSDICGQGSQATGTSVVSLVGGNLGPEESCTFSVTLQTPQGVVGSYNNTTSPISAMIDGASFTGEPATDLLFVSPAPLLTKTFLDDPVGAGGSVDLEFSITNTSPSSSATEISFEDVFVDVLPTASATPASGFCGPNAVASFVPPNNFDQPTLRVSGASLDAGSSCTFTVTLDVALDAPAGLHTNTTSPISAIVDGETAIGSPARDDLLVVAAPSLFKEFVENPVAPGDLVTLRFTLSHDELAGDTATGITFSDDLDAALSGLQGVGLPMTDVCGTGSQIVGTSTLTFDGGILVTGESCSFDVSLQVPPDATPGTHINTTSPVTATVFNVPAMAPAATADVKIAGLTLSKEFVDDPVLPGGAVTARYVIENASSSSDATNIIFFDNFNSVVPSLEATGLPMNDICGVGSSLTGTTQLVFQGGALAAGTSCSFDIILQVPAGATPDTYASATSQLSATMEGSTLFFDGASDALTLASDLLTLSKQFVGDPVAPGSSVMLQFVISNVSASESVTDIAFTDDLETALAGLEKTGSDLFGVCGAGSQISGDSVLGFTGGSLAPGTSCTFEVELTVPENLALGTIAFNQTSPVSGSAGGLAVTGDPATDELRVDFLTLSKNFAGDVFAGEGVELVFTIENFSPNAAVESLSFTDDLEAMIPGLVAIGLPESDVCGAGSRVEGSSVIAFSGGSMPPDSSCSFGVELLVPSSTPEDEYLNITSDLKQYGLSVAAPATDQLNVFVVVDEDNDGVLDSHDYCPGTFIPEGVPTIRLGTNRFALVDSDFIFDTSPPSGNGPGESFTTSSTGGCSCEQIIEVANLGQGHVKFGCSLGEMLEWVSFIGVEGSSAASEPAPGNGGGSSIRSRGRN